MQREYTMYVVESVEGNLFLAHDVETGDAFYTTLIEQATFFINPSAAENWAGEMSGKVKEVTITIKD